MVAQQEKAKDNANSELVLYMSRILGRQEGRGGGGGMATGQQCNSVQRLH